ncbi:MAG: hypothetical protein WC028_04615 [Candidatus Obscuribacterales bacterium]
MTNAKPKVPKIGKSKPDLTLHVENSSKAQGQPSLYCAAASGSAAINYLANDATFAEQEAQIVLDSIKKQAVK